MKNLLFLILLTAVPASATDWHVYVSTDPSDGRNQHEVAVSTSGARLDLPGATVKCVVTNVVTVAVPPFFELDGRYLQCDFLDGSQVAQFTGCLRQTDNTPLEQHSLNAMYIQNLGKLFEISVQCLDTTAKKPESDPYPNEPEDKSFQRK